MKNRSYKSYGTYFFVALLLSKALISLRNAGTGGRFRRKVSPYYTISYYSIADPFLYEVT